MKSIYKSEAGKQKVLETYKEILEIWPVENKQYGVETSYGSTFVIESGSAENPPLILLHGSMSNSFTWYSDVEILSRTYRVYAIDIIGEPGFSAESRPSYESGAYPVWLDETIQALGIESCSLAGLSLGGWMVLSYATTYPQNVDNLVLMCPGGLARENASFIWKAIFFAMLGKWGERQTMKLINGGRLPDAVPGLERALAFMRLIGKNFNPRMAKLPLFDGESLLKLNMPVLVIYGENDYLLPARESIENLTRYVPQTVAEILPDTGHVVVNQGKRIARFLANIQ